MKDKEIVEAILNGDEKALKHFIDTHKIMIVNACYALTHNREEAEDIAQEVFLQAYESLPGFRFDSKLSTWLYRMAVNKAINHCRSFHRKHINLRLDELNRKISIPSKETSAQEIIETEEKIKWLHIAMDKLSDNQRIALTLCEYEELSYKEIAEVMGISVSAVESLLFRARSSLEKKLKNYLKDDTVTWG